MDSWCNEQMTPQSLHTSVAIQIQSFHHVLGSAWPIAILIDTAYVYAVGTFTP